MKIVIIGGVAGGASAAARLRRLNEQAEIIILERGGYVSFANCGLPYYIGGEIEDGDDLLLQTPESFKARFNIDVRVHSEAVSIDRAAKTVVVRADDTCYTESYDKLLLAPGAAPIGGAIPGAQLSNVFMLRSVENAFAVKAFIDQHAPRSAVVVGGGYIGIEMCENLRRAGLDVTVVEFMEQILNTFDADMACDVQRHMEQNGVTFRLGTAVRSIEKEGDGLCVTTDKGNLQTDLVILAIGVAPDTKLAADCGLTLGVKGAIVTDDAMRTSDPDIYACGDAVQVQNFVTGQPAFIALAGPANKQGRIAADNICGLQSRYHGTLGSAVVKAFDMTAAGTGLNERQAKAAGLNYETVVVSAGSHASYYPGAHPIIIKALFERESGRLLGAQLTGMDGVDKRADVLAAILRAGGGYQELIEAELCYAPPYSSAKDPVNMVGFVMENIFTGKVKQFHWSELPVPEGAVLLDARTDDEYAGGAVPGAVHIPVDELRERMGELDVKKPLYVYCHSGLRSYIACRILTQNGFDCYNISGGWRLYESITRVKKQ